MAVPICTACSHPKRHLLDEDLRAGMYIVEAAQKYGLKKSAVGRHKFGRHHEQQTPRGLPRDPQRCFVLWPKEDGLRFLGGTSTAKERGFKLFARDHLVPKCELTESDLVFKVVYDEPTPPRDMAEFAALAGGKSETSEAATPETPTPETGSL
jgi:hypothetical protein